MRCTITIIMYGASPVETQNIASHEQGLRYIYSNIITHEICIYPSWDARFCVSTLVAANNTDGVSSDATEAVGNLSLMKRTSRAGMTQSKKSLHWFSGKQNRDECPGTVLCVLWLIRILPGFRCSPAKFFFISLYMVSRSAFSYCPALYGRHAV